MAVTASRKAVPKVADDICHTRAIHLKKVQRAEKKMRDGAEYERLADRFRLLADPTRLRILDALSTGELCVCDISSILGSSESAVSHQLRLLRSNGIVKNRRQGRIVFYSLADQDLHCLLSGEKNSKRATSGATKKQK